MDPELFRAATRGSVTLLERVLAKSGDVVFEQVTPAKDTVIHIAARHGRLEFVKHVQTRCPTYLVAQANSKGDTAFHVAARAGHSEMIRLLLNCVALRRHGDVELGVNETHKEILRKRNNAGDTAMHDAVRNRRFEAVKLLIEQDPGLLCLDNYTGESPLYAAVEQGKLAIVKEILHRHRQHAVDYSHSGPNSRTALHAAVIRKRLGVAKLLLGRHGELAKVVDDRNRSPLHFATAFGFLRLIKLLLNYDTSAAYLLDKNGMAPIHIGALYGRVDIIQEFLRRRPDLKDLLDGKGRNLLHIAIEGREMNLVKYILLKKSFKAALNEKDHGGHTPLHRATISCQPYVVNLLVKDKRVDRMALNSEGFSALEIAMSQTDDETAKPGMVLVLLTLLHVARPTWSKNNMRRSSVIGQVIGRKMSISWYKKKSNTLMVVATLVATVTFAACFTMPGGYNNDGTVIVMNDARFELFVLSDALGLYASTVAVIALVGVHLVDSVLLTAVLFYIARLLTIYSVAVLVQTFVLAVMVTVSEHSGAMNLANHFGLFQSIFAVFYIITIFQPVFPLLHCSRRYVYFRSWLNQSMLGSNQPRNSYKQRLKDASMLLSYKISDSDS